MGLFLLFCLISRLLVLSCIFNAFKISLKLFRSFDPKGGWAHLISLPSGISGLSIFLSAPLSFCLVLLLILSSCFCFWPSLLRTFQKCPYTFVLDMLFCIALVCTCFFSSWEISWSVVSVACYLMALVLAM